MAKNKKIVRYRKPLNINVGMIIFAMIFVYLSFSVYTYLSGGITSSFMRSSREVL